MTITGSGTDGLELAGGILAAIEQLTRLEFSISPSPIRHDATVWYSLPTAADVELSVFDLAERKVATLIAGRQPAGRHSMAWHDAERLSAGLYFARFRAGADVRATTIVRVK